MAAESSRSSSSSADTYIGSLISLTSKSEIRYEGILYNINTEESSIGLRNVRSFGSEGRKKDGPQIMPSEKVYEYILFRGSDIKDLQVKTSPPVQPTQNITSDPAIIQSHYPRPTLTPSIATGNSISDHNTPSPQLGQHPGIPLYQPDGSTGSWGPSPPPPNVNTSLPMPMYWPGFYPQSMFRPMQYPNFNAPLPGGLPNLPEYSSSLLPTSSASSANLTSSLPPVPPLVLTTEPLPNFLQTKPSNPDVNVNMVYQGKSQINESMSPSLVTPGQLLQSGKDAVVSSSQSSHAQIEAVVHKDVELAPLSEESVPVSVSTEAQPPILPLPTQARNGAPYHNHQNYRGGGRGRGFGGSRTVMKFTEEFDFTAMNEKFNKDEVWGSLGKTNKSGLNDIDGNVTDEDELQDENNGVLPKIDVKPVYSKDDFFDTLSCNSIDHQSNNGRTRFSEQMKLDTETFGEFSRYRGGRGGRGPYRGGRSRGGGYYNGRGYGYVNRGRGGTRGY
ncbi:hypothetical protein L2E82_13905 [Cichorium intybus]|uniref:Uncharacterized protein n=1 Tax=Cichorium intybus TaxID=13427 RepID=A0ACB9EYI4_CICIN|nr:hypothetical protein L1887_33546 [Cichorium endivia]KAI3763907.1 hypothetical protein L2E82_13905 [Cichorium intybus]